MRLSQLLKLDLLEEDVPADAEADFYLRLTECAEQLLRGCGLDCIPVDWWVTWGAVEKRALADAGDRIRTELALLSGMSTQGSVGAALVNARLDGGQSLVRHELMLVREDMKGGGQRTSGN